MPFSTATILGIAALGVSGAGLGMKVAGDRSQTAIAKQQAGIGAQQAQSSADFAAQEQGINQQASDLSYFGAAASAGINKSILGFQQGIEAQRFRAMNLDSDRRQLEIIRQQQRARSLALATSTAQGSARGGSSALGGAYGQISGQTETNLGAIRTSQQIGANVFGLNANITNQRIDMNDLQTNLAFQQADLTTQKSKLISQYAQLNAGYQTQLSYLGGSQASAAGQSSLGGSLLGLGPQIFSAGMAYNRALDTGTPGATDITYKGPQSPGPYPQASGSIYFPNYNQ